MASKKQFEDWEKERENKYLASQLGISYDELMDCKFDYHPITTNDGGIVGCLVQFY